MRSLALISVLVGLAAVGFSGASSRAVPTCSSTHFTIAPIDEFSEPTGQHTLGFVLRNHAGACSFFGYPALGFYDRKGKLPFAIRHRGDQMVTDHRPKRFVVRPRGAAFVVSNKYRCDLGSRRISRTARLGFPGETRHDLRVPVRRVLIDYCGPRDPGSEVHVSPFEPTLRAALRLG